MITVVSVPKSRLSIQTTFVIIYINIKPIHSVHDKVRNVSKNSASTIIEMKDIYKSTIFTARASNLN